MEFFDTHTHLYLPEFDDEPAGNGAVDRAIDAGVTRMIFPNVDLTSVEPMLALAAKYKANIATAMGLHPTEVKDDWREVMSRIDEYIGDGSDYVAIGEVGMDLYWDKTFVDAQMQVFEHQAARSVELDLPLIIHCRDGLGQALEVLEGVHGVRGVFHSFGGTERDVDDIRRRAGDFYFGVNGIVTFKNSKLRQTLPAIGIERIVLETDSPYLAPVPHRGKRNESSYLPLIGACVAESLGLDLKIVASATTANASRLFDRVFCN